MVAEGGRKVEEVRGRQVEGICVGQPVLLLTVAVTGQPRLCHRRRVLRDAKGDACGGEFGLVSESVRICLAKARRTRVMESRRAERVDGNGRSKGDPEAVDTGNPFVV